MWALAALDRLGAKVYRPSAYCRFNVAYPADKRFSQALSAVA